MCCGYARSWRTVYIHVLSVFATKQFELATFEPISLTMRVKCFMSASLLRPHVKQALRQALATVKCEHIFKKGLRDNNNSLSMYITFFDYSATGLGKRTQYMIKYLVHFQVKVHCCFILHRHSLLRSPTCSDGLCTSGLSPIACYTCRMPRPGLITGHAARKHSSEMESSSTRTW